METDLRKNKYELDNNKRILREMKHKLFVHFNKSLEELASVNDHECNIKITKR